MSTLLSGFITTAKLEQILATVKAKNEKGFAFTASINEEPNQYGQNVSFYAEQSKEQRDAKAQKFYFGNGKVFWTDGVIKVATAPATPAPQTTTPAGAPPPPVWNGTAWVTPQSQPQAAGDLPF